jgi:septum formation protein
MTTHDPALDPVHLVRAADAAAGPRVVLASQSPRRRDLLDLVGVAHRVRPADVDESVRAGEAPDAYTERLALEKARVIAAAERGCVVVAADTTVVIDGEILGKPVDAAQAREMLRRIADYVTTGEPMDKAGAYGIQGYGAAIVERIEGDYFAVMGLSLVRLVALFGAVGVTYVFGHGTRASP